MRAITAQAFWRRSVAWLLLAILIGGTAGAIAAQVVPRSYQTTSRLLVSSTHSNATLLEAQRYGQQVDASIAAVATTPLVLRKVIRRLRLDTTPAALATQVSARAASDSAVIGVSVADGSPTHSARIANAISEALVDAVHALTPTGPNADSVRLTVIEPARASAASSGTGPLVLVGLGIAAGLIVALVVLLLRSRRPKPPRGSWRFVWVPRSPSEPA